MKILYFLLVILLMNITGQSQSTGLPPRQPVVRIVKFYPNPATTQITFDFQTKSLKNFSFQVYNFIGKKVFELNSIQSAKSTVDLSNYFRGLYIFQLKDGSGKIVESGKFQVVK